MNCRTVLERPYWSWSAGGRNRYTPLVVVVVIVGHSIDCRIHVALLTMMKWTRVSLPLECLVCLYRMCRIICRMFRTVNTITAVLFVVVTVYIL